MTGGHDCCVIIIKSFFFIFILLSFPLSPVQPIPPMPLLSPFHHCPQLHNFRTSYTAVGWLIVSPVLFISSDLFCNHFSSRVGPRAAAWRWQGLVSWLELSSLVTLNSAHACRGNVLRLWVYVRSACAFNKTLVMSFVFIPCQDVGRSLIINPQESDNKILGYLDMV